jgi:hypothetical protein
MMPRDRPALGVISVDVFNVVGDIRCSASVLLLVLLL